MLYTAYNIWELIKKLIVNFLIATMNLMLNREVSVWCHFTRINIENVLSIFSRMPFLTSLANSNFLKVYKKIWRDLWPWNICSYCLTFQFDSAYTVITKSKNLMWTTQSYSSQQVLTEGKMYTAFMHRTGPRNSNIPKCNENGIPNIFNPELFKIM